MYGVTSDFTLTKPAYWAFRQTLLGDYRKIISENSRNLVDGSHALTFTIADLQRFDLVAFDLAAVDDVSIATPGITVVQSVNAVTEPASVLVFLTLAGAVVLKRRRTQKV